MADNHSVWPRRHRSPLADVDRVPMGLTGLIEAALKLINFAGNTGRHASSLKGEEVSGRPTGKAEEPQKSGFSVRASTVLPRTFAEIAHFR